LIKVNMLATGLTAHKVLKVPRCRDCSTLNEKASTSYVNPQYIEQLEL
jgi:hypothetical protein